jgi:hypothetical protein
MTERITTLKRWVYRFGWVGHESLDREDEQLIRDGCTGLDGLAIIEDDQHSRDGCSGTDVNSLFEPFDLKTQSRQSGIGKKISTESTKHLHVHAVYMTLVYIFFNGTVSICKCTMFVHTEYTYRGRVERGGVYLPSQRTPKLYL